MKKKDGMVYRVATNDADYKVTKSVGGKRVMCPFYRRWMSMLTRCYNPEYKSKYPTYQDCYVDQDWLKFSNFKKWMEKQNWQGMHLDKDLIVNGNKAYKEGLCIFIPHKVNTFFGVAASNKSKYPIGVFKDVSRFYSSCHNPFTNKVDSLGYFDTEEEAHQAWRRKKIELAHKLAECQDDKEIAALIIKRAALI